MSTPPESKDSTFDDALGELREGIDSVDNQLVRLLSERAHLAKRVGELKSRYDKEAYVPEREHRLLNRLMDSNPGPLPNGALKQIYKEIISGCLSLESPLQVVYLGPEGTFTHQATKRHFGMSAQLMPRKGITEIFQDVECKRAEYGVVPIENSTEGVVNPTLDAFMNSDLAICAEVLLPVSHHLLTQSGTAGGINKIYSHPQAIAQCREWLQRHMVDIPCIDVSSTARAAQLAAEDPSAAAIASELAGHIHGLEPAHRNIEDLRGNMTRFLVIGHQDLPPTGDDRTSLMFALKDQPGVLYDALAPFAQHGINMSRIESRPSRRKAWEYLFFIDLVGHKGEDNVAEALRTLSESCQFMKVLGSYPRGLMNEDLSAPAPTGEGAA